MVRRRAFTPAALVAVVLGGAIGVAARAALVLPFADADRTLIVPSITLAINVAGSFLLGLLVGWVDDGRPLLRAFVGTGILGGFTTYSAFAVQVVELGGEAPVVALAIAAVSIFAGVLAAGLGLRVGHAASARSRRDRSNLRRPPNDRLGLDAVPHRRRRRRHRGRACATRSTRSSCAGDAGPFPSAS